MKNYDEFIEDFATHSPFEAFYQRGIKPNEIKDAIIESLYPYFENKTRLIEYSMTWLIAGWVNFSKFNTNPWHMEKFQKCLTFLNKAKNNNVPCFSVIADWLPEFNEGLTRFWSFKRLSQDLSMLNKYEFLEESLKLIGQVLEGITKNYFNFMLHVSRLSRGKKTTKDNIKNLDLGVVINELINSTDFPELLSPPPRGIKLNDWRNIAYHHNAKVKGDEYVCWYGKAPNLKEFSIDRGELLETIRFIININNLFRNLEFIFIFDNLPECQLEIEKKGGSSPELRQEVKLLELFSGVNSQGFKIIDYQEELNCSKLTIQDLTDADIRERACHSSQFLYTLWFYTSSEKVMIEYRLKNGKPYLISKTDESVCNKIAKNEKGLDYLAEKVEFEFFQNKSAGI